MAGMWQIFGLENLKKRKSKYKIDLSLLAVQLVDYFMKLAHDRGSTGLGVE
jgi:hypothetical protein